MLDEASNANCTGNFYAGSYPTEGSGWVNQTTCEVAYSGGNPTNDIKATPIVSEGVLSMDLTTTYNGLSGMALEYTNGAICESTG